MPDSSSWLKAEEFRANELSYPSVAGNPRLAVEISLATPLYGGGVEPGQIDAATPFRTSGIRGALRHWWRATRGAVFEDWRDMRERESAIWGDTDRQSSIRVEVDFPDNWSTRKVSLRKYERDLNRRYALFPPYNKKGVALDDARKDGFLEGGNFTLTLSVAGSEHKDDAEAALWAWVNLGGLGARTRRGAGSLFCHPYAGWNEKFIKGDGRMREWPTLKGGTVVWGAPRKGPRAWEDAWTDVLQLYREFRQDRQGRGPTAWPEPDEIRAIRQHKGEVTKEGFPRGRLGLPIVFHFKDRGEPPDQTLSVARSAWRTPSRAEIEDGRMSSPVILKPLIIAKDLAYPVIIAMNCPGPGQLYLFQKDAKTEQVSAGLRDSIAELILRAQRRWGGSITRI